MVIVSKGYDVSRLANLRPGGSNVLYAPGVGKSTVYTRVLNPYTNMHPPQPAKTQLMSSSASTVLKLSYILNTPVCI
jgi:hypothetical protein